MSKEGCGFGCLAIIALFILMGTMGTMMDSCAEKAENLRFETEERERLAAIEEEERKEVEFAQDVAPDLQRTIENIERELKQKQESLDELAQMLEVRDRDPNRNDTYRRWRQGIAAMTDGLQALKDERADLYIKFFAAARDGDRSSAMEDRIQDALAEVRDVSTDLDRIRSASFQDADNDGELSLDDLDLGN